MFSEGTTNTLIGCSLKSDKDLSDCIVIRVNGEQTDFFIDRQRELLNIQLLHTAGCSGQLYAIFDNGLAYQFLQGECLDVHTVREHHIGR